ncbi:MAG TPA: cache domain-containing protein, partial [Thermoanaerobaculia bacterium]|nr:cache domain-containing protein [Thermoanaerobaculia bacterium]
MSATPETEPTPHPRRARLLWTLLGAMVLVGLLPLVVSHYFLIGINRDSLETLERKYLTRSAVGIATDLQNLLSSNSQQLTKIAGSIRVMRRALPPGTDPFVYAAETGVIADYLSPDGDLVALRVLNLAGQGAEAKPAGLDAPIVQELNLAVEVAGKGQPYTGTFQTVASLGMPAIVIAVPVVDGGQVIGVVEAVVNLKRVADHLAEEGKGDVTAFVVDRNGKVLMHSEPAVNVQRPDFAYLKIVKDFGNQPARLTESYVDNRGGEAVKMLGTVAPVNRPDWGVVVQKPEAMAYASVSKMERATIEWTSIALV